MTGRLVSTILLAAGWLVTTGCSATGGASSGFSIGKNLMRKDSNLRIFLDGHEAQQDKLKKGLGGHSPWTIKEQVAGSPKFKYEIIDPKKHGFIKHVTMAVHQKFEADFSDIADYVIHPRENNPDNNMKPGVEYDLGNLGQQFRILDRHDKEVDKVQFHPGKEYLLVFSISADKSETIQVYFKSN